MRNPLAGLLARRSERYRQAFGTPSGQWVLSDLATRFHAMAPTHGDIDVGERNVLLWIFQQLRTTEQDALDMVDVHSRGEYLE